MPALINYLIIYGASYSYSMYCLSALVPSAPGLYARTGAWIPGENGQNATSGLNLLTGGVYYIRESLTHEVWNFSGGERRVIICVALPETYRYWLHTWRHPSSYLQSERDR